MAVRKYDMLAEQIIGKVAKHARHSKDCNILQSAKQIAYVFADMMYKPGSKECQSLCDAIARVCPENKMMDECAESRKMLRSYSHLSTNI